MARAAVGCLARTRVLGAHLHTAAREGRVMMVVVPDANHVGHGPDKLMAGPPPVKPRVPREPRMGAGQAGQSHPNAPAVSMPYTNASNVPFSVVFQARLNQMDSCQMANPWKPKATVPARRNTLM